MVATRHRRAADKISIRTELIEPPVGRSLRHCVETASDRPLRAGVGIRRLTFGIRTEWTVEGPEFHHGTSCCEKKRALHVWSRRERAI